MRLCPNCNSEVGTGNKFCGNCGAKMDAGSKAAKAKTIMFSQFQQKMARLVLIKGSGQDGTTFYIPSGEHIIGRTEGQIRSEQPDPFLSPAHAKFAFDGEQLVIHDLESQNGVFIRIKEEMYLNPGDVFMLGKQVFRLIESQDYNEPAPEEDGTYFYFTPHMPSKFLLVRLLQGGIDGDIYRAEENVLTIGREGNAVDFPSDPFISGNHARIEFTADGFKLTDLNSRNGTFFRIKERRALYHGDFVYIGQQLFRVEIT